MRKRTGKLLELWPVFLIVSVYYISYFNPDLVIAPMLLLNHHSKPWVVLIVGSVGFLEMLGGYKGWSGMRGLVLEKWLKDAEFVKKLKGEEVADNFVEGFEIRLTRKYLKFTDNKE